MPVFRRVVGQSARPGSFPLATLSSLNRVATVALCLGACTTSPADVEYASGLPRGAQTSCQLPAPDRQNAGISTRDSLGIQIVENWFAAESLDVIRPAVRATVAPIADSTADLSGVIAGVTLTSDGRIVLADARTSSLALFDSSGAFVRLLGQRGEGPGEFQGITAVTREWGDTIAVVDLHYGRRLTRVTNDGVFVGRDLLPLDTSSALRRATPAMIGQERRAIGYLQKGTLLAYIRTAFTRIAPAPGQSRLHHDTLVLQSLNVATGDVQQLGMVPYGTVYEYTTAGRLLWSDWAPFAPRGWVAVGENGYFYGRADRYEIGVFTPNGIPKRFVRMCLGPVIVDSKLRDAHKRRMIERAEAQYKALSEEALDAAPQRTTGPFFEGLLADRSGWIWIGDVTLPGDPHRWLVVDPSGVVRAMVALEPGVRLAEVGSTHLLGIRTDGDDLQTVVIYDWQPLGLGAREAQNTFGSSGGKQ